MGFGMAEAKRWGYSEDGIYFDHRATAATALATRPVPTAGTAWLRLADATLKVKLSLKSGGGRGLDCEGHRRVRRVVHGLDQTGPGLGDSGGASGGRAPRGGADAGRPLVDRLKVTKIHHLKELRPGSRGRSEIRIIFAFDPTRSALLLLGGDKAGNWARWYRENIPVAEQLYIEYTADEQE
jgi:hypothetical protein